MATKYYEPKVEIMEGETERGGEYSEVAGEPDYLEYKTPSERKIEAEPFLTESKRALAGAEEGAKKAWKFGKKMYQKAKVFKAEHREKKYQKNLQRIQRLELELRQRQLEKEARQEEAQLKGQVEEVPAQGFIGGLTSKYGLHMRAKGYSRRAEALQRKMEEQALKLKTEEQKAQLRAMKGDGFSRQSKRLQEAIEKQNMRLQLEKQREHLNLMKEQERLARRHGGRHLIETGERKSIMPILSRFAVHQSIGSMIRQKRGIAPRQKFVGQAFPRKPKQSIREMIRARRGNAPRKPIFKKSSGKKMGIISMIKSRKGRN